MTGGGVVELVGESPPHSAKASTAATTTNGLFFVDKIEISFPSRQRRHQLERTTLKQTVNDTP
jgi:hypothetical protein